MFFRRLRERAAARRNWLTAVLLAAILLLALGLRLVNLGAEPLWGDEILSLDIATYSRDAAEMTRYLGAVEVHPPLYYLLLRPWTGAFGHGEAGARSLSVVFGLGVIVASFFLSTRLFRSRRAGLVAALVVALMPFQIEFSQEARPYIIFCFFGTLAALCLWDYLETRRKISLVGYVVCSAVGPYLHYSYFLVLGATASWWLFAVLADPGRRTLKEFRGWLLAHGAVFLAYLPWLPFMLHKMVLGDMEILGLPRNVVAMRPFSLINVSLDQLVWLTKEKTVTVVEFVAIFAFKVVLLVAAFSAIKNASRRQGDRLADYAKSPTVYCLWLAAAVLLIYIVSPQSMTYTPIGQRHVIFVSVALATAFSGLAVSLGAKRALALTALLVTTQVPAIGRIIGNDEQWDPAFSTRSIAQHLNEQWRPGDLIVTEGAFLRTNFNHYLKAEIEAVSLMPAALNGLDFMNDRHRLGLIENESQARVKRLKKNELGARLDFLIKRHGAQRVWIYNIPENARSWADDWFEEKGWHHGFRCIVEHFCLDEYVSPAQQPQKTL